MTLRPEVYGNARTLGGLDEWLTGKLDAHGYGMPRYYGVPGGFMMVAPIERIRETGEPFPEPRRWSLAATSLASSCDMKKWLTCLFRAQPGRYRVLVFVASTSIRLSAGPSPTFATVKIWSGERGASYLPATLAAQSLAGRRVTVLIYEFLRPSVNVAPVQVTGLSAIGHLKAAGLIR